MADPLDCPKPKPLEEETESELLSAVLNSDTVLLGVLLSRSSKYVVGEQRGKEETKLLHKAVSISSPEVISLLLQYNASMNSTDENDWTPLHIACHFQKANNCKVLLQNGADVTLLTKTGNTPLHIYVRGSQQLDKDPVSNEVLHKLITLTDVSQKNLQGETPLHLLALSGNMDTMKFLWLIVKDMIDINAVTNTNETPLHYAIRASSPDIVTFLLERGADVEISSKDGNAMQMAIRENNPHILDILTNVLSKRNPRIITTDDNKELVMDKGRLDLYGFVIDPEQWKKYDLHYEKDQKLIEERQIRWSKFRAQKNLEDEVQAKSKELLSLLSKGIPRRERGDIWFSMAKAQLPAIDPTLYPRLLQKKVYRSRSDIEKDVDRTFPAHSFFSSLTNRDTVRRILLAYSIRNPSVGYCQSMNFLVGILLLNMSEEKAFWALCFIVDDVIENYFIDSMIGLSVDQRILESLAQEELPKLYHHLEKQSFPLSIFTTRWFMCLFFNTLPTEVCQILFIGAALLIVVQTCMRIWDVLLLEGARLIILVAFSLLKRNEKRLLAAVNTHQLMIAIDEFTVNTFDVTELLEDALKNRANLGELEFEEKRLRYWNMILKERVMKHKQMIFMQQDRMYYNKLDKEQVRPSYT